MRWLWIPVLMFGPIGVVWLAFWAWDRGLMWWEDVRAVIEDIRQP